MDLRNEQSHCSAVSGKELSNRGKGILLPACSLWVDFELGQNDLRLKEVGDFEALHCQPSRKFDRSTKLDLTNEPPLLVRCGYVQ